MDSVLRGQMESTQIVVHQAGGIRPTPDWKGAYIADAPDESLMLPGERWTLLLRLVETEQRYVVESFTGMYKDLGSAGVAPLELNPFGSSIRGESLERLEESIRAGG